MEVDDLLAKGDFGWGTANGGTPVEDDCIGLIGTSLDVSAKYGMSVGRSMADVDDEDRLTKAGLVRDV